MGLSLAFRVEAAASVRRMAAAVLAVRPLACCRRCSRLRRPCSVACARRCALADDLFRAEQLLIEASLPLPLFSLRE